MFNDVEVLQYIVYQISIVVFPILIYYLFINESASNIRGTVNVKLSLILILIVFLTMSFPFPVKYSEGYFYDFRILPFILAFFYGGKIQGAIIAVTVLVYRLYLGGEGFYHMLISYSIATIILFFIIQRYRDFQMKGKILIISLVFWTMTLTIGISLLLMNQSNQLPFLLIFSTISWVSLLMVVFIIESINHQRAMQQELQKAEKLNVISQLAASVAHEVRNPMTTVRGFLQLMNEDINLNDSQKNYIFIAINELDHAQSIINDYLSLAKPHNADLISINISDEVHKTIELMSSYSNILNISIKKNIQDSLYIKGNRGEIKQVLINIIKNGIESMETGGLLDVQTYESNGRVYIEIIDTGKGMTKSQLNKIGTPFYTTKEKGTGIGLTISYQLIHSMKGKINVDSEIGKGTVFTIQFPIIGI